MKKLIWGVGVKDTGEYDFNCESYMVWYSMLRRCYSKVSLSRRKTYENCTVVDEWLYFQNFASWYYSQISCGNYELDKDLLVKGNKLYSGYTCCLIPTCINSFLSLTNSLRGKYPVGVSFHKRIKKFQAQITRGNGRESLGYFVTEEEAFYAYKKEKEAYAKELAEKWRDKIDPRAYEALMNYTVEITD